MFLISQDKTGLPSLAPMRHLGANCRPAWLIHHKIMATMAQRDPEQPLSGNVQLSEAYLGGERAGVGGRGSPHKVPIVAAVVTCGQGHPKRLKVAALAAFTREAMTP